MGSYTRERLPPGIERTLGVEPDEKLLWASARCGTDAHSLRFDQAMGLVLGLSLPTLFGEIIAVRSALAGGRLAAGHLLLIVLPIVAVLLVLLIASVSLRARFRPTYFLTSKRLLVRRALGGFDAVSVRSVREIGRLLYTTRTEHGGHQTVATDALEIMCDAANKPMVFGPSRDIERVEELLANLLGPRSVALSMLPGLMGELAPAERKGEFFFARETYTDGDVYGPLFVGPRCIVRLTEALPTALEDILYTELGENDSGECAEEALLDVLRRSRSGHFVELLRADTKTTVHDDEARLEDASGRVLVLRLPKGRGAHLAAVLAAPLKGGLTPLSMSDVIRGPKKAEAETPRDALPDAPKLADPTLEGSAARTLALGVLSQTARREITTVLGGRRYVAFAPASFVAEHRGALAFAAGGVVLVALTALTHFGASCTPRQAPDTIAAYALGVLPFAYLLVAYARHAYRAVTLPFTPGLYVFPKDVVVARSDRLRIIPLEQVAAVSAAGADPLTRRVPVTLFIECEPSERGFVPAREAASFVESVDAAREKLTSGGTVRDPLSEMKKSGALIPGPVPRDVRALVLVTLLTLLTSACFAVAVYLLRNVTSDATAFASARRNRTALECYAQNEGLRADEARRIRIPHLAYLEARALNTSASYGEFLSTYPHAADAPRASREREVLAWRNARDAWGLQAFIATYPRSRHIAEARRRLPVLALETAKSLDVASAYAQVMREHAGTPEAEEAQRRRHARFAAAESKLAERRVEDGTKRFLIRLLAYLEAHDGPEVLVRFRSPSTKMLRELDELLFEENAHVEPIAPYFRPRENQVRELTVFSGLRDGFGELVPADVLTLVQGGRLPPRLTPETLAERLAEAREGGASEEAQRALVAELRAEDDPPATGPEIRIDYAILPTGSTYSFEGRARSTDADAERAFAGFRIEFVVEIRLGAEPERFTLRFSVTPPATIDVASRHDATREIYATMCRAAFERLATELETALIGHGASP